MQYTQGYVSVKNGRIFYKTMGNGIPLFIAHGGPGLDQTYLQPYLTLLAQRYQVVFFDQRGAGKSLTSSNDVTHCTLQQFIQDIESVRLHLNLEKIILMGHSWGALLALYYAQEYQQNVYGLLLLNTQPVDQQSQELFEHHFAEKIKPIKDALQPFFSYNHFKQLNQKALTDLYTLLFSVYTYRPQDAYKLQLSFTPQSACNAFKIEEKFLTQELPQNPLTALETIVIPVLVVHGQQDIVPVSTAQKLAKMLLNSRLIVLNECGHFPYVEQPSHLYEAINAFIDEKITSSF